MGLVADELRGVAERFADRVALRAELKPGSREALCSGPSGSS